MSSVPLRAVPSGRSDVVNNITVTSMCRINTTTNKNNIRGNIYDLYTCICEWLSSNLLHISTPNSQTTVLFVLNMVWEELLVVMKKW